MSEFTNESIEIDLLPKYQEVELKSPDPKYWKVMLINIFIFFVLTAGGLTALIILNEEVRPYYIYCIAGFIVLIAIIYLLYRTGFKKRGYALREKDIIYKSGIIAETTSIIPLNRIQHVALDEGLFSRTFKLATLQIYTAGGASGHMHIAGIPVDEAKAIKEALLKKLDLLESSTD